MSGKMVLFKEENKYMLMIFIIEGKSLLYITYSTYLKVKTLINIVTKYNTKVILVNKFDCLALIIILWMVSRISALKHPIIVDILRRTN